MFYSEPPGVLSSLLGLSKRVFRQVASSKTIKIFQEPEMFVLLNAWIPDPLVLERMHIHVHLVSQSEYYWAVDYLIILIVNYCSFTRVCIFL